MHKGARLGDTGMCLHTKLAKEENLEGRETSSVYLKLLDGGDATTRDMQC